MQRAQRGARWSAREAGASSSMLAPPAVPPVVGAGTAGCCCCRSSCALPLPACRSPSSSSFLRSGAETANLTRQPRVPAGRPPAHLMPLTTSSPHLPAVERDPPSSVRAHAAALPGLVSAPTHSLTSHVACVSAPATPTSSPSRPARRLAAGSLYERRRGRRAPLSQRSPPSSSHAPSLTAGRGSSCLCAHLRPPHIAPCSPPAPYPLSSLSLLSFPHIGREN